MADETKTVIYNVEIPADQALKTLAELQLRSAALKQEQKELGPVTAENAQEYYRLQSQIKAINTQAGQYQKQIQNNIKLQNQQEASLEKLRTQLALDNAEFAKLGNTQEDMARKAVLGKQIAETVEQLKTQEEALGNFTRSVGNYERATIDLKGELRELTQQLQQMALEGEKNSDQYNELRARAEELKTAIGDVNAEIQRGSSNTQSLDTLNQSVQGVVAGFTLWKSASALVGKENEDLDKVVKQIVIAMGALNALTVIQNTLYKTSNTYRAASNLLQKIGISQTAAEAKALAAKNAMMASGNTLTKVSTTLTWLWNAALAANPVVLLTLGIAGLVGGIVLLSKAFQGNTKDAFDLEAALKRVEVQAEITNTRLKKVADQNYVDVEKARLQGRSELAELKKNGATKEQIAAAEYRINKQLRDAQIKGYQDIQRVRRAEQIAIQEELQELEDQRKQVVNNVEEYNKLTEAIDVVSKALYDNQIAINQNSVALRSAILDQMDADNDYTKTVKDNAKARADAALSAFEEQSNLSQKYRTEALKALNVYQSTDIKQRLAYERQLFNIQQEGEKERLEARKKAGKITQAQYDQQLSILEATASQFNSKQIADTNAYFKSLRDNLIKATQATEEEQIATTIKNYTKLIEDLAKVEAPVQIPGMSDEDFAKALEEYEQFAYQKAELELRLTRQMNEEITKIREASLAKRIKDIDDALQKEYEGDLARYSDNEAKKLSIQQEMLKKQIAAYKAAGKDTAELESQLRTNELSQIQVNLNRELLINDKNNKKRYQAKKAALEAELELSQDNFDRQLEIQQELADAQEEYWNNLLDEIQRYSDAVGGVLSGITNLVNTNSDRQLQKVQQQYDKEQLALARKHSLGILTEAEYNEETLKLEQQKAKDEAKIERDKAIREKDIKVFTVITDTAMGVAKAVAASPLTFGLPWSAFVGATGALQLATILSEPLPKAARGAYIKGPGHPAGGVNINAEGGEAIINKRSTSMFLPLLSAINELGGGIPFTTPFSDGGFSFREAAGDTTDNAALVEGLQNAISQIKIYTAISDIRREDKKYSEIEGSGSLFRQ